MCTCTHTMPSLATSGAMERRRDAVRERALRKGSVTRGLPTHDTHVSAVLSLCPLLWAGFSGHPLW